MHHLSDFSIPYGMVEGVTRLRIVLAIALCTLALTPERADAEAVGCSGPVVLLVHDVASSPTAVAPLARRLEEAGRCVLAPSYGVYPFGRPLGGMRAIEDSAVEVESWIRDAATASGGAVDVVGHGAGSLVAQRAAAALPGLVRTFVALGGAWRGTNVAFLGDLDLLSRRLGTYDLVLAVEKALMDGSCAACREVIANSDYLRGLSARGPLVPGVRMVNIVTRYDELVVPYSSGTAPGMRNVVLQDVAPFAFVEHLGLPASPVVAALVEAALRG